jgi:hypothetical protein
VELSEPEVSWQLSLNFILNEVLMKIQRCFMTRCALLLLPVLLIASFAMAEDKKKDSKNVCASPNPASMCTADNTCGSASSPCTVNIKRTSYSSSATPSIPGAKGNDLFCVQAGTTVVWQATDKNTGFLVDPGKTSPFDPPGSFTGGSEKSISTVAKTPGCITYHFSATAANGIYGKSKAAAAQLIVVGGK